MRDADVHVLREGEIGMIGEDGMIIIYGRGLIAGEYCRYLEIRGMGAAIAAFAVTKRDGQGESYCGRSCLTIEEALARYPKADIHLALQEKYHAEVLALLKDYGKAAAEIIGLRRMTELWGEQAIREIRAALPELTVRRSPYDYSVLEISSGENPGEIFTFYPMAQVPLSEEDLRHIREYACGRAGLPALQEGTAGICPLAPEEGKGGKGAEPRVNLHGEDLYIAMATSPKDARVRRTDLPEFIHPVLGGAAVSGVPCPAGMAHDDDGPSISRYNDLYSELTVAYWLWQKAPRARYLGLCHYRRHFVLTHAARAALAAGTADVLLTRPRLTLPSVRAFFTELPVSHTDGLDYATMLELLERQNQDMADFAGRFFAGQVQYPNNMVIAKREIYLDYCKWMFAMLQGMQEHYRERRVDRPARCLGNVGEMLTAAYFAYHRSRWRTGVIDYRLLEQED